MATNSRRFDAVMFDVGGVLVVPDPVGISLAMGPFGGRPDLSGPIRGHFLGTLAMETLADQQGWSTIEGKDRTTYRAAVARACGVIDEHIDQAAEAFRRIISPSLWTWPLRESGAGLAALHRKGVPMGVVSNADGQVEHMLRYQGVCQVGPGAGVPVRVVIDSAIVGIAKPDPAIFEPALAHFAGIERHRIAYVGDTFHNDVTGAHAAGLTPLLFDPYDDRAHRDCERIRSIHEVAEMF